MKLFQHLILLVTAYVAKLQAAWAEFGPQLMWPALAAAADLSGATGGKKQYIAVRMASATTCNIASEVLVTAALKGAIGILQNEPKSGEPASIAFCGLSKVRCGGTVTAGAGISYNSSGMIVDAVSGDTVLGRALETGTTANEILTAMLFPPVKWANQV